MAEPGRRYAAVAIVRDEAAVIDVLLDSIAPHVTTATFVDTGSTDDTVAKIEARGYTVHHRPWVDFGTNRSQAFTLARGSADWILALDADMTVEIDPDFTPDPTVDAYLIEMGSAAFSYRLPLLLNGQRAWKSVGAVHEYTVMQDGSVGRREPTDQVRITMHGGDRSSPAKTRWHAKLLRAELARDPGNARATFYLAQSERELGHAASARRLYRQRAAAGGFEEERWYAQYRAALLPWDLLALLTAWQARPHRLEPLYAALRGLNERSLHHAAYALASTTPPVPAAPDILFVEPWVADYGIAFERSISAWHVGSLDEFERLTVQLLANPRLPAYIRAAVERNAGMQAAA